MYTKAIFGKDGYRALWCPTSYFKLCINTKILAYMKIPFYDWYILWCLGNYFFFQARSVKNDLILFEVWHSPFSYLMSSLPSHNNLRSMRVNKTKTLEKLIWKIYPKVFYTYLHLKFVAVNLVFWWSVCLCLGLCVIVQECMYVCVFVCTSVYTCV